MPPGTEPELRRCERRGVGSRRASYCDSISRFAGGWGRRWRRGRRRPPPRGKDDQRDTPSEEEHAAYEHPDRDPEQERQLGPEVAGDGRLRANPDEERLRRRAFSADPYLAQPVVVPDPIRPTRVHLELLARQRVRRGREPLSRGR